MEQNTDMESSHGRITQATSVNSNIITSVARANIDGVTSVATREPGRTTRCTAVARSLGPMVVNMLVIIMRTKRKAKVL